MTMGQAMDMAAYLAIPAFSQGVVEKMLSECPRAAWYVSHLNPNREPDDPNAGQDAGSIAHSIVLEGSTRLCKVFDPETFPNAKGGGVATGWTNNAIREARDIARAEGLIPILRDDFGAVERMAGATRSFIGELGNSEPLIHRIFSETGGVSERVFQWDDDGVPCKIRVDRISATWDIGIDLKYTKGSVEPSRWARTTMLSMNYPFGGAFYRRGIKRLTGVSMKYFWLNTSAEPPHLSSLCGQDAAGIELADAQVDLALKRVRKCLHEKYWPDYGSQICYVDTPSWAVAQWEDQQIESGVFT